MEETRVAKYQKHREGLKEETPKEYVPFDNKKDDKKEILGTTSTLPLNEVLKEVEKDTKQDEFLAHQNKIRILKWVLIGAAIVLVIGALVALGIYAWR